MIAVIAMYMPKQIALGERGFQSRKLDRSKDSLLEEAWCVQKRAKNLRIKIQTRKLLGQHSFTLKSLLMEVHLYGCIFVRFLWRQKS